MGVKSKRIESFLLLVTLVCHTFGVTTGTTTDLSKNPSRQVNGILGQPALLPIHLPRGKKASRVEWIYQTEGIRIATFEGRTFNRSNHRDRFGQRLQMAGDTALRIQDLEMEDSGTYVARVLLGSTRGQEHKFSLTVYETVPEPQITSQVISNTPEGCNVTLQCHVFGKGVLNVSWETGNPLRATEGDSDWYQLSANGSDLHMSWRPNVLNTNVTCRASNPAERKEKFFDLRTICLRKDGNQSRRKWPVIVSLCVVALIVTVVGVLLSKRGHKPQQTNGGLPMICAERNRELVVDSGVP